MKKNLILRVGFIALLAIAISGCTTKKKKNKCDTCPKWGYVVNEAQLNVA